MSSRVHWSQRERRRVADWIIQHCKETGKAYTAVAWSRAIPFEELNVEPRPTAAIKSDSTLRALVFAEIAPRRADLVAAAPCARCAEFESKMLDAQVEVAEREERIAALTRTVEELQRAVTPEARALLEAAAKLGSKTPDPKPEPAPIAVAVPPPAPAPKPAPLFRIGLMGPTPDQVQRVAEHFAARCEVVRVSRAERDGGQRPSKLDWLVIDVRFCSHGERDRARATMGKRFTTCLGGMGVVERTIEGVLSDLGRGVVRL